MKTNVFFLSPCCQECSDCWGKCGVRRISPKLILNVFFLNVLTYSALKILDPCDWHACFCIHQMFIHVQFKDLTLKKLCNRCSQPLFCFVFPSFLRQLLTQERLWRPFWSTWRPMSPRWWRSQGKPDCSANTLKEDCRHKKTISDIFIAGFSCLMYWHFGNIVFSCLCLCVAVCWWRGFPAQMTVSQTVSFVHFFFLIFFFLSLKILDVITFKISNFWETNRMRFDCKVPNTSPWKKN